MNVFDAVRARRSIKRFTDRPVSQEEIESLLELAVLAPNHRMTEPWRFVVVGPETRRTYGMLKGRRRAAKVEDPVAAEQVLQKTVEGEEGVPTVIGFVQRLDEDREIREEDYASIYMGVQNVLLAAVSMGLGTHVKTGALLDAPESREAFGVKEGERLVALVQLGEPEETPQAKPRASAAERTSRLP